MSKARSDVIVQDSVNFRNRGIIAFTDNQCTFSFGPLEILSISKENGLMIDNDLTITTTADNPLPLEVIDLPIGPKDSSEALPAILATDQSLTVDIDFENRAQNPFSFNIALRTDGVDNTGLFTVISPLSEKIQIHSISIIVDGTDYIDDSGIGTLLQIDIADYSPSLLIPSAWQYAANVLGKRWDAFMSLGTAEQIYRSLEVTGVRLSGTNKILHAARKWSPPQEISENKYLMIRHGYPTNYVPSVAARNVNLYLTISSPDPDIEVHKQV